VATLKRQRLPGRVRAAVDQLIEGHAHVVFSQRRAVGLLIIAALATQPRCLLLGLCALIAAELAGRALGLSNGHAPYGYNALLCGIAIASDYVASPVSVAFASALGAGSVLMTAALGAVASYLGYLPLLSVPFVLTSWLSLGAAPHLSLIGAPPLVDVWADRLPSVLALALQSFGGFLLMPNVVAGALVLAALLWHSRIASVLAISSVLLVIALLQLAHAPLAESTLRTIGCSAGLASVAIGGIWLVPSRGSSLLALGTAVLAAFFALGCLAPLSRLGLSLSFVPFNAAVILVLSALRQRVSQRGPALAGYAAESPEQLLMNHVAAQPAAEIALRLHLPFHGAWTCTQGVDGPYTHRGILRHGYDFEIYGGPDGALCGGAGTRPQDYHCFNQPVLAAADGTVIAIENAVPNNAVGEDNGQKPWGNHVILQHASSVYSLTAHLAAGCVVVYPGQYVARGTVLGYCGNSGRAPRPHLHFQLQSTPALGSPTLSSAFSDVVVRSGQKTGFEATHVPAMGEAVQTLQPDYALAAHFELPIGATLTYRVGGQLERVVSELDVWGRSVLRSIDRGAQLAFTRSESRFNFGELRGDTGSVLRLLRLALAEVPFERHPKLTFRSTVPARWLGGWLRRLWWDLTAAFVGAHGIELHCQLEIDHHGIAIVGASLECDRNGTPLIQTRVLLGGAVGPRLLEVTTRGRAQRAELVTVAEAPRGLPNQAKRPAVSGLPIRAGEWS
jgi:urea transporter